MPIMFCFWFLAFHVELRIERKKIVECASEFVEFVGRG